MLLNFSSFIVLNVNISQFYQTPSSSKLMLWQLDQVNHCAIKGSHSRVFTHRSRGIQVTLGNTQREKKCPKKTWKDKKVLQFPAWHLLRKTFLVFTIFIMTRIFFPHKSWNNFGWNLEVTNWHQALKKESEKMFRNVDGISRVETSLNISSLRLTTSSFTLQVEFWILVLTSNFVELRAFGLRLGYPSSFELSIELWAFGRASSFWPSFELLSEYRDSGLGPGHSPNLEPLVMLLISVSFFSSFKFAYSQVSSL